MFRLVFFIIALLGTFGTSQAQDISFIFQDWKAARPAVSMPLRSFADSSGRKVELIGAENNFGDFQQKTQSALDGGADLTFWIGLSEADIKSGLSPAIEALGVDTSFDVSDWAMTLPNHAVTGEGIIALGAGFSFSEPREKTIISVPYGTLIKLPIVSAVPFQSSPESAQSIEEWTSWLYGSNEGKNLQQALSLIPMTRTGSNNPGQWIQVISRPIFQQSDDDDGCGCGEHSTCDPDGFGFGAMSDLEREDGFAILPGITQDGLLQSGDDGGCGCDARAMSFNNFFDSSEFSAERLGAQHAGRLNDWISAVESLQIASLDEGQIVTIMTCDPD